MFYCKPCSNELGWPVWGSVSAGPCEVCRKLSACFDVPSSALPPVPPVLARDFNARVVKITDARVTSGAGFTRFCDLADERLASTLRVVVELTTQMMRDAGEDTDDEVLVRARTEQVCYSLYDMSRGK